MARIKILEDDHALVDWDGKGESQARLCNLAHEPALRHGTDLTANSMPAMNAAQTEAVNRFEVSLTQEELGRAIVQFAARKAGLDGTSFKHNTKMNCSILTLGDEPPIVVTLEPLNLTRGGQG